MPPPLAPRDTQKTWKPTWVFACAALPHSYAIRDLSVPATGGSGTPFTIGESEVGGEDLIGGGAGGDALHAWGHLAGWPTVTRRIPDPFWPLVEQAAITLTIAERLTGDYVGEPFSLSRYDEAGGVLLYELGGVITQTEVNHEGTTITGTNLDTAILEEPIPTATVTPDLFPLASDIGQPIPWLFGNTVNMPLVNVHDDQILSQFDYLLSYGAMAALPALRRVPTGGEPAPGLPAQFEMTCDELEPYPGMDGVLVNGAMENWDAGPAVAPDGWTLAGAGATVAKDITAGEFAEGAASAAITAAAAFSRLNQTLTTNAPQLPVSWWQGREVTLVVSVRATVAGRVFVRVADGVGSYDSAFHSGSGLFEELVVGTVGVPCILNVTASTVSIVVGIAAGAVTTAQFDDVRFYLRAKSLAECLRPDLYDGYTAIRTFLRQEDSSGALFRLVADVHGLQPERNMVRAARTLLTTAPPYGLGRTVDAASFDAAEAEACLTHPAAVLLDGPELFAHFSEAYLSAHQQTVVIHDQSGHERHGVYDKGGGTFVNIFGFGLGPSGDQNDGYINDSASGQHWVEWPSDAAYSGQAVSVRVGLQIPAGGLPDVTRYPIVEKLVGTAMRTGYGMYRELNVLVWFVVAGGVLQWITSPLVDVTDEDRWIDIVGTASEGVLKLYRDGLLVTIGSYTGDIAEGEGAVLVAKFGTGSVQFGEDRYENVALYSHALSADRVAALHAALPLDVESVNRYDGFLVLSPLPTFIYKCNEDLGDAIMADSALGLHAGAWVGGPTLGVASLLTTERGLLNAECSSVHFANDVSKYGIETGMTLNDSAATIAGWYAPAHRTAKAGLVEKTIGSPGVRDTQWGFCQRDAAVRFTLVHAAGTLTLDVPVLVEDKQRPMFLVATWASGAVQVYKNGVLAIEGTYTAPVASGVGDFYIGVQGSSGAGTRTRPAQGDLALWSYTPAAVTAADVATNWLNATWYNGGLCVDLALREARQAQEWLASIGQLRGLRIGVTAAGAIIATVDATTPSTILIDARDGPGDGDQNIVAISGRQRPPLEDRVRDIVVKYRKDERTGAYLGKFRRAISTKLDANGRRVGQDRKFTLDAVREHPSADRFADYAAQRLAAAAEGKVDVTLHQEARRLLEGDLVQVTDALMGYASEVMEVIEVRKELETISATVQGWPATLQTYTPSRFPPNAGPG